MTKIYCRRAISEQLMKFERNQSLSLLLVVDAIAKSRFVAILRTSESLLCSPCERSAQTEGPISIWVRSRNDIGRAMRATMQLHLIAICKRSLRSK